MPHAARKEGRSYGSTTCSIQNKDDGEPITTYRERPDVFEFATVLACPASPLQIFAWHSIADPGRGFIRLFQAADGASEDLRAILRGWRWNFALDQGVPACRESYSHLGRGRWQPLLRRHRHRKRSANVYYIINRYVNIILVLRSYLDQNASV